MIAESLSVRDVSTSSDLAAMAELFTQSFDRWPPYDYPGTRVEYLEWLTRSAGETAGYARVAETSSAELVVAGAFTGRRAYVLGREDWIRFGAFVATAPAFRRQGAQWVLAQNDTERWDGFLTYSRVVAIRRTADHYGIIELGDVPEVRLRVLRTSTSGWALRGALRSLTLAVVRAIGVARRRGHDTGAVRASTVSMFDKRYDDLSRRLADWFDFAVARDADYLNWRYADAQGPVYRCFEATDVASGQLLGVPGIASNPKPRPRC